MSEEISIKVINHRVNAMENEIKDFKKEVKEHNSKVENKFEEQDDKMDDIVTFNGRIEYMFSSLSDKHDDLKKNIDKIADKQEKDKGWRAVLLDFIKVIGYIVIAIASGKFIL